MKNLVNRLWLMSCSSVLFITYLLCFGNVASFSTNTDVAQGLTYQARNAIVETTAVAQKSEGVKEQYKEEKKEAGVKNILIPLLPLVFTILYFDLKEKHKKFRLLTEIDHNLTFIPALGANAPPVYTH